jgi:hypothetical protein
MIPSLLLAAADASAGEIPQPCDYGPIVRNVYPRQSAVARIEIVRSMRSTV